MFRHEGKGRTLKHNLRIATILSFATGIVNVTGFLAFKQLTTNVTGHFALFISDVAHLEVWKGTIYLRYIFSFLIISSIVSCATFPRAIVNPYSVNEENINSLNGKYSIIEISRSSLTDSTSFSYSKKDIGFDHTIFDEIDSRLLTKRIEIDSSKNYALELKILNPKRIGLYYFQNEKAIRQLMIKYKIKDDGYLYLKNRNFKIKGIPYLFGEINVKKNRITLNKESNLIFESSEFSSGGVALLMVYPVGKAKYQKIYKRIE